jgi:hypothetical protein
MYLSNQRRLVRVLDIAIASNQFRVSQMRRRHAAAPSRTTYASSTAEEISRFTAALLYKLLRGASYKAAKEDSLTLGWSDTLISAIAAAWMKLTFRQAAMCWTASGHHCGALRTRLAFRMRFCWP